MKLSVIILAGNHEKDIPDCLTSVSFADEILVVLTNSTDNTRAIAKKHGARIVDTDTESFAEKRNIGLKHAKGDWVLYIDTDERVSSVLRDSIQRVVKGEKGDMGGFRVRRKNFYLGNHEWPKIEKLERLFLREKLQKWQGVLHETAIVDGDIGELDGFLFHYTHKDLTSMLEKTIIWSEVEANLRYNAHHPKMTWWRFPRVMATAFYDSYFKQGGWKAGTVGLIESMYQAYSMFITYARLWEKQEGNAKL